MDSNAHRLPHVIENAMYGFMQSYILFVGDELGVFDLLSDGELKTISEIASFTKTDVSAIERLLISAVSCGLLTKNNNQYTLPQELRPFLSYNSKSYCGNSFPHFKDSTIKTFQFLKQAMFDGECQINRVCGGEGGNPHQVFDGIYANKDSATAFLTSMWGLGFKPAQELVHQYSLASYRNLVDIGGATGSFSIAALNANQNLHGTIFDLAAVEPFFNKKCAEFNLMHRLKFKPGNFFTDEIPDGDVYVLGYILSDWSTAEGSMLLSKIYDKLPPGGIVIILEKLFNTDKTGPIATAMMNLAMLLETNGKHRSYNEYSSWLNEIGFVNTECIYSSGEKHMIVGQK